MPEPTETVAPWQDWHLVINGESYYSRWADYDEWEAYYLWLNHNQLTDSQKNLEQFKQETTCERV